jgi:nitrile hydratase accessory protein
VAADLDGPTFHEPWQAQAFALVVRLAEGGAFSWREWTEALAGEIAAAGPDDRAELYYEHWLAALEKLADAKGLTDAPSVTPAAMPGSAPPGRRRTARPSC